MIDELILENFKLYGKRTCFTELKKINLLTGINGRGKSSFVQPLLIFKQTLLRSRSSHQLFLSGSYVDLGNAGDMKHVDASVTKPIHIGFRWGDDSYDYKLAIGSETSQALDIKEVRCQGRRPAMALVDSSTVLYDLVPEGVIVGGNRLPFQDVIYISAERTGPKLSFAPSSDLWIDKLGEHTIQMLYEKQYDHVPEEIMIGTQSLFPNIEEDELSPTIGDVLNFWMTKMFGKSAATVSYIDAANIYTLGISTEQKGGNAMFKPTNVGFGYSYALPVLIAGLTAAKGSILIVENPEAHLHPSAQSIITKFLSLVADSGIQVFIETHSEHVLNALRVMVVQQELDAKDINVMYFDNRLEGYYESVVIAPTGKLDHWPANFFDQSEKDLNILLGI